MAHAAAKWEMWRVIGRNQRESQIIFTVKQRRGQRESHIISSEGE